MIEPENKELGLMKIVYLYQKPNSEHKLGHEISVYLFTSNKKRHEYMDAQGFDLEDEFGREMLSMYKKEESWGDCYSAIGEKDYYNYILFYKGKYDIETIAHEASHAAYNYLKKLSGRKDVDREDLAIKTGRIVHGIIKGFSNHGILPRLTYSTK